MVNQNPYVDPLLPPTIGADTAVVLLGIDGSETSWHALSWACGEARQLRGRAVGVFDCGWNDSMATGQAEHCAANWSVTRRPATISPAPSGVGWPAEAEVR
jgi:hypothetical protein